MTMRKILVVALTLLLLLAPCARSSAYTVVFMGDSITEVWVRDHGSSFFTPNSYLGKGISGQTTAQMLQRFRKDVINFSPRAVVIFGGINDIAQNKGYIAFEETVQTIMRMAEIADENGIKVAVVSLTPTDYFFWNTSFKPAKMVRTMNTILEEAVLQAGYTWIDMYSAFIDKDGAIDEAVAYDRLHPSPGGLEMMEQIIQPYLEELL